MTHKTRSCLRSRLSSRVTINEHCQPAMLSANGEAMSAVRPQYSAQEVVSNRHAKEISHGNDKPDEDGHKFGIVESYSIMQAAVSVIILSIITQFWAEEGQAPSAFIVLFFFQLFILIVALILLASGNDAWFSFVFAQLVFFMGVAELTTSAFVCLRDTKLERCMELGCTIVRGSPFMRSRFIYASAVCGIFHTTIGIVYLILGPHCRRTPEPTIIISKSLLTRLRSKLGNLDRSGSTLHTMSRQPELGDIRIDECVTQPCATTASSAQIRLCSAGGADAGVPYAVRTLQPSRDFEASASSSSISQPLTVRATIVQNGERIDESGTLIEREDG
ncbi:hypothetical protein Tcan_02668 [Toxocara canis]|uniref:Uncharacterized protein n=1 Tax=Toxocara canis TaxID=6265 RepID=A0A0B2VTJ3_TOXCA|nr:hypothetical protein Tcan_02668 [Toxocara canis]